MASDENRTRHWLMTCPLIEKSEDTPMFTEANAFESICSCDDTTEDRVAPSPVSSIDFDRESPMAGAVDDDDDDIGPPSIETQPPDNNDNIDNNMQYMSSPFTYVTQGEDITYRGLGYCSPDIPSISADSNAIHSESFLCEASLPSCSNIHSPIIKNNFLSSGDIEDQTAIGGICGLKNLGNTCFMAAGLQCLINTPPIAQYFFTHWHNNAEAENSLIGRFSQLTHKIWSGRYSSLQPTGFKFAFGQLCLDFRDYRQHDCQEFITLFLEALRKQMHFSEDDVKNNLEIQEEIHKSKSENEDACYLSLHSPLSPLCHVSPLSSFQQNLNLEIRNDVQDQELVGLDSGPASPRSSISSSSTDAHLMSLRLHPIPEEVRSYDKSKMILSLDDISEPTMSCHDAESVASDVSESETANDLVICDSLAPVSVSHCHNSSAVKTAEQLCDNSTCDNTCIDFVNCDNSSSVFNNANNTNHNEKINRERTDGSKIGLLLEDIMKESKTSNVNVLANDNQPTNNELLFDSEKYAKFDRTSKLKNSVDNLRKSTNKRIKEVNLLQKPDNTVLSHIQNNSNMNNHNVLKSFIRKESTSGESESFYVGLNKRIRLEEKNVQHELERSKGVHIPVESTSSYILSSNSGLHVSSEDQRLAVESWNAFAGCQKSAIVDTFYGQFRSSLVCSACSHTSIKFDPFGTLSVPLPHASEVQIPVTYIPGNNDSPIKCLVTLCKVSHVKELREAVSKMLNIPQSYQLIIAEVFDNHIARIVDDTYMCRFLNYSTRNIYAYHLALPPVATTEDESCEENCSSSTKETSLVRKQENAESVLKTGIPSSIIDGSIWKSCNICLEEMCLTDLKTHDSCEDCLLCDNCVEMSCKHHGGTSLLCPVCHTFLSPGDLVPVAKRKSEKSKPRVLRVPVVYRVDQQSDDNNKRQMQLVGHPHLLALPSSLTASMLMNIIASKLQKESAFSILLVDGRGFSCSRCLFSSHCRGCEAMKGAEVNLVAGDTLCIRFIGNESDQWDHLSVLVEHPTMKSFRQNDPLTLYDCLRAFTQRFLFHGTLSTKLDDKVIFPLNSLDLSDYVCNPLGGLHLYDLYACVCHVGVAQAGHYTALVQNPVSGEWNFFNDDTVTKRQPREEEFSTAYLLFYHRQGTPFSLKLPKQFAFLKMSNSSTEDQEVPGSSGLEEELLKSTEVLNSTSSSSDSPLRNNNNFYKVSHVACDKIARFDRSA